MLSQLPAKLICLYNKTSGDGQRVLDVCAGYRIALEISGDLDVIDFMALISQWTIGTSHCLLILDKGFLVKVNLKIKVFKLNWTFDAT